MSRLLSGGPGRRDNALYRLLQCLAMAPLAAASYLFISGFIFQSVQIVGRSMAPTLQDSRRYLFNRLVFHIRGPRRDDIVVIRDPADRRLSVKRIIALAGDSVYLKDGSVYVNGRKLQEPYLPAGTPTFPEGKLAEQWLRCGQDQYIVLGDNRKDSADSRSYGPVSRRDVLGLIEVHSPESTVQSPQSTVQSPDTRVQNDE